MTIQDVIEGLGRKALVENVLGIPFKSYGSPEEWVEDAKDYGKRHLPDCVSWQTFVTMFDPEIREVWEEHRVQYDLFPDWTIDEMAEDMEKALSIRSEEE